ncbi:MAG: hypothetical protein QOD77_2033 [Thermoplasmata archaeon]|jgi:hypothetical protein|nr:hypothetical protein [Thermoplasmata archaeon]
MRAAVQSYPVKPGHAAKVDFGMVFDACFDAHEKEGDWYAGAFGSMPTIRARYEGKKELQVDTVTDKSFAVKVAAGDKEALAVAMDTQRRWNEFLEAVTGYDAKARSKKIQEMAKKGAKDAEAAKAKA